MEKANGTDFAPGMVKESLHKGVLKRLPLRNMDKLLLFSAVALSCFGVLMVYSATRAGSNPTYYIRRHVVYLIIGLIAMFAGAGFDYRKLMPYSRWLYGVSVFLLMAVFVFPARGGSHRWINLGFFDFQPSELAKLAVIILIATFVADRRMEPPGGREFLYVLGITGIPMLLIFAEPDLGTTLLLFAVMVGMLMLGGARVGQMVFLGVSTVGLFALAVELRILKTYQLSRLLVFIKPDMDPLESGYNLMQSKIAIGSGQLLGKGLFRGTQTNLKFIPAHHTDFIFAVVAEELGFMGAALLLALLTVFIWRAFRIAAAAKDHFGNMLAVGIVLMMLYQVLVNVGMTMGIMPTTGITLPFMSYGGTSLILNLFCTGLLLNIGMRRFPQG